MHVIGRALPLLLWLGAAQAAPAGDRVIGASSSLKGKPRVMAWTQAGPHWTHATFQPASAMDSSLATSWCEGTRGPGVGEWIEVQVDHPVREVEIAGGFRKLSLGPGPGRERFSEEQLDAWFDQSVRTYKSNGRPAVVELTTEKGQVLERFQMGDRTLSQYRFPVSLAPGKYRLRIAQIYPGTRSEDACIAELQFRDLKAPAPPQQVPEALGPIATAVQCRAAAGVKVLPAEVLFLGTTVSLGRNAANPNASRTPVAVRSPSGVLSPIRELACFWARRFVCVLEGEGMGEEALGSGDSVGEWRVMLEKSTAGAADPGTWTGDYQATGEKPRLTFQMAWRHGAKEEATFAISALHDQAVVETAQYTCAPLP